MKTIICIGIFFQQILNFTYDLTKPPDGQWGSIQPDNSWSGLVGMLMAEEIDMGMFSDNVKSIAIGLYLL